MAEPGLVRGLGGRLALAAAAGAVAAYVGHRITARRDSALLKRVRKGVFIEKSLFDDPATALRLAGIEWVLLETAIQKAGKDVWISRDRAKLEALEAVINPPGSAYRIEIWGWGWPIPAGAVDFAAHVGDVLQSDILAGYCLDIEAKSWSTKTQPPATMELTCAALINAIRARSSKSLLLSDEGSPVSRCRLDSGDVTLLAGEHRLWQHTVERIIPAPLLSPLGADRGRLSITIRVAGGAG